MSNKNPFEIRAEILELAKDYMDKQTSMNIEFAERMFELGKFSKQEYVDAFKPYSFDEMMKTANEMYHSFVSNKNT